MSTDFTIYFPNEKTIPLGAVKLSNENRCMLDQLLKEFRHIETLSKYNLPTDNKLLLYGQTGCGKTTTARAIAHALDKKIITLNLGNIVSSRLGETAKNMTEVFKKAKREKAVLFLDEFDFLGKTRDYEVQDSGEMKRLVNSTIQMIDLLPSDTLLIAATNHSSIIDTALLRRFQLKLKFEPPTKQELDSYYEHLLSEYPAEFRQINRAYDISYAEARDITLRAVKNNIIAIEEAKNQST